VRVYCFRFKGSTRTGCEKKLILVVVVCSLAIVALVIALAVTAGNSDTDPSTQNGEIGNVLYPVKCRDGGEISNVFYPVKCRDGG